MEDFVVFIHFRAKTHLSKFMPDKEVVKLDAREEYWLLTIGRYEEEEIRFTPNKQAVNGVFIPKFPKSLWSAISRYTPLNLKAQ